MEEESLQTIAPPDLPDEPLLEEVPTPPLLVVDEPSPSAPPLPAPFVLEGLLYANGEATSLENCVGVQIWQPDNRTTMVGLLTTYQKQHKFSGNALTKRGVYKQFPVNDVDEARNLEAQIQAYIAGQK